MRLAIGTPSLALCGASLLAFPLLGSATTVTYAPYIQPGDQSPRNDGEHMVIAFQTDEPAPNPAAFTVRFGTNSRYRNVAEVKARIVDNYLATDPALPVPPNAYGAHSNYLAVLDGLERDTTYYYKVTGPGLPASGFLGSFHTRKSAGPITFEVMGDEGSFPAVPNSAPARLINYEARIIHEMYAVDTLQVKNLSRRLPKPDFVVNTGDNVYNQGSEDNYRDFYFSVWNNDTDSNETGAPLIRHLVNYIVAGNHDIGGNGDYANLLGDSSATRFSGGNGGGDALAYFNNFYYPLNGPKGLDAMYVYNGNDALANGFRLSFGGQSFTSPVAIDAFRASTAVDTGAGTKRQIDTMGNYSFDQGDVHFVFLDSNPHLFASQVDYSATYASPQVGFSPYPSALGRWLIHDLDSSSKLWKIVVFHHSAVSSGNATLRNFQMRSVQKLLEDHGVNLVFNGHEHNYQRTYPLRALPGFDRAPAAGAPLVAIDGRFDGRDVTVPDGLITLVEGAGGNRDFDENLPPPRGNGVGAADQEDSATGGIALGGQNYPNGPASWLDDHLTNAQMAPFIAGAGAGPKITAQFKGKLFSFAHVTVDETRLTLHQISEPLQSASSATATIPYPFGTDSNGVAANDPIPDTQLDGLTGQVVSAAAIGTPTLLDAFTVNRPNLADELEVKIAADPARHAYQIDVRNRSRYALNGAQAVLSLPRGVKFTGSESDTLTSVDESKWVVTLGRIAASGTTSVSIPVEGLTQDDRDDGRAHAERSRGDDHEHRASRQPSLLVRSATALPVSYGGEDRR